MRVGHGPRRIVMFEPRPSLGAGVAYSTDHPDHLLNVPARSMSAYDDDPGHFIGWLSEHRIGLGAEDFVPRSIYRRYLNDILSRAQTQAIETTLIWVRDRVTTLRGAGDRRPVTVCFGEGRELAADRVVLAVGAPPATILSSMRVPNSATVVADPWLAGALESIPTDGDVLILGTGLTMVDVATMLAQRMKEQRIHARSRRGLLPAAHTSEGLTPWPALDLGKPATAREALHHLRTACREAELSGCDWRSVISAARQAAPDVWRGLAECERRRVLRHASTYWDVARHRMAPQVAAKIEVLRQTGRLSVGAGRVVNLQPYGRRSSGTLLVRLIGPRGCQETLRVRSVVDCTGTGATSPLTTTLIADRVARRDPAGLGLAVDGKGDLVAGPAALGCPIHTIGWCRRGREFESTAVSELRVQAATLALRIAAESRLLGRQPLLHAMPASSGAH
jgi:uncharacterized NAD(P)/FAD-binding protein YdhS